MPKKLDVEMKDGKVVAIWFGWLALPFRVSEAGKERARQMTYMSKSLNENADKGDSRMMDLLEKRLDFPVGPSCKVPEKYVPPSDEITSREA